MWEFILSLQDPDTLSGLLSEAASSKLTHDLLIFAVAAWIHSGRVKKEIANQFQPLTKAIEDLGLALREDMGKLWGELAKTNKRVDSLETKEK